MGRHLTGGNKETFYLGSHGKAWNKIRELFPDKIFSLDQKSSDRAGYKIYRNVDEYYDYICDLEDRLEINIKEGNQTINLWINKEDLDVKGSEPAAQHKIINSEVAGICNKMTNEEALETIKIAISALEKQIPKKPKVLKVHEISNYKYGECQCGEHIMDDEKYCSSCGQALDWSNSDAE